jgi:ATP-dependent Lon protease
MESNIINQKLRRVPIVAIRGSVVFPNTDAVLTFGRKKSVAAVNSAFQEDKVVAIFTQRDPRTSEPDFEDLYKIGTIAVITQMMSTEGEIHAVIRGRARVRLNDIIAHDPYLIGMVEELNDVSEISDEVKATANRLVELFKKAINLGKQAEIMTVMKLVSGQPEPREVADQIASLLEIKTSEKQKLLETLILKKRLEKVLVYLGHEVNVLEL